MAPCADVALSVCAAYQQQMDRAKTMFAQKFGKPAAAAAAPAAAQAQAPAAAAAATHAPAASATSAAFGALSAEERKKVRTPQPLPLHNPNTLPPLCLSHAAPNANPPPYSPRRSA